jgi:integral membrane sensor domain MASE1
VFEHRTQPLLPFPRYMGRLLHCLQIALFFVVVSLFIGTLGYRITEGMSWIDAFYNASLILSGMGPAIELQTNMGKIFASLFSLYSGLLLIAITGLLLAPVFHRILHTFHTDKTDH